MGTSEHIAYPLLQQYLQQQSGSLGGLLGSAIGASQGWNTGTAQPNGYSNQFQPQPWSTFKVPNKNRMIKFFRVNEKVEVPEGVIDEPLDELRIKVAKWLYN